MVAWETAALKAAGTVGSRAGRAWLAQRSAAADRDKDLTELMRITFRDVLARRKVEHQLDGITLAVMERLQPLCEQEFRGLDDADRAAVLAELSDTLERADLTDQAVLGADADPAELVRRIRSRIPRGHLVRELGEAGARMFDVLLEECCDDLLQIVVTLPQFTPRATAETLSRLTGLSEQVAAALARIPRRTLDAPEGEDDDAEFDRRYTRHVSQVLDTVELFGVQVKRYRPRTSLSVAYISLSVSARARRRGHDGDGRGHLSLSGEDAGAEEPGTATMRVESALGDARRTLVRGEAGSGKSTLLRWLAITAVREGFDGELAEWNGCTPFLVKLRSHARGDLPGPERFLEGTADPLAGLMPRGWVHRRLLSGRALLLVDGVDELSTAQRRKVPNWLRDLLAAYPGVRVVVTSRPAAASARWLAAEGFTTAHLEPMGPSDLRELVRQWHRAMAEVPQLPCAVEDLPGYESSLLARLEGAPHLRSLAATPLLAAMLCALNLDHRTRLPRDRMGLYAATLEMLLDRRDDERDIPSFRDVELDYGQKLRLLQDLAWRLSLSQRSELPTAVVLRQVEERLSTMPGVRGEPRAVTEFLLQRTGTLREPVEGRVDFVHRTVQEYLTAKQAVYDHDVELLVRKAHLPSWRETVVMAAGHANRPQLEELLGGVLARIDAEPQHARTLKLLVAACLETAPTVPVALREAIDGCVDDLLPPRDLATARSLSTAGERVLDRLPESLAGLTDAQAKATVHAVALVNGDRALEVLAREGYRKDGREVVQRALQEVWGYFEPDAYARRVLADAPLAGVGEVECWSRDQIRAARHLRQLRRFHSWATDLGDLALLEGLPRMERLELGADVVTDIRRLPGLGSGIRSLQLSLSPQADAEPLTELPELRELSLMMNGRPDLGFVARLPRLRWLNLLSLDRVRDYSPLLSQPELDGLWILGCEHLGDVELLPLHRGLRSLSVAESNLDCRLSELFSRVPRLRTLSLNGCDWAQDLQSFSDVRLDRLHFGWTDVVDDLDFLSEQSELVQLSLPYSPVRDLNAAVNLDRLEFLNLNGCAKLSELTPLAALPSLRELSLLDVGFEIDLEPLASLNNLVVHIRPGHSVSHREAFSGRIREVH
ncbi:NACHT domain-containing protein [Nocardiopsis sp. NPDC007018]|uniref:NACHT N-terminal Helical domain 1-containing protein n=1 Tax=Nocardiopsis sp. NPDC007018 TaxID=3155721 RepID=UPI0033F67456